MKYYTTINIGYVEQAIGTKWEFLDPPISISKNGSLAKWRNKLDFIDLRINDPSLKLFKNAYEQALKHSLNLKIPSIVTLPEFTPHGYNLPDAIEETRRAVSFSKKTDETPKKRRLVFFRPSYLALPSVLESRATHIEITPQEYFPIIDLAIANEVKHLKIPVSTPGLFLDPKAEEKFISRIAEIYQYIEGKPIKLHLRNGGLSKSLFETLNNKYPIGLCYNVGIGHLERDNILQTYKNYSSHISILACQQVLPGVDKWNRRNEYLLKSLTNCLEDLKKYNEASKLDDKAQLGTCLNNLSNSYYDYSQACKNESFNIGLFQNGDLNLVPLLKEVRKNLKEKDEFFILIESVPNIKNNDFVLNYLAPDRFRDGI